MTKTTTKTTTLNWTRDGGKHKVNAHRVDIGTWSGTFIRDRVEIRGRSPRCSVVCVVASRRLMEYYKRARPWGYKVIKGDRLIEMRLAGNLLLGMEDLANLTECINEASARLDKEVTKIFGPGA